MARQNLGAPPSRPTDLVDVAWAQTTYPSYSQSITATADYTISLPPSPVDHTMYLVEVLAQNQLVVSLPAGVLLTVGTAATIVLYPGKTGFFGFRYSANSNAWFLLSATSQV